MKSSKVPKLCLTGLMAAIITVFTAFIKIPTGLNEGYIHLGDAMIYLSACLLGPLGALSAVIGGAIADILSGAVIWVIPTAIIKSLICVPFIIAEKLYIKKKSAVRIVNSYTVPMAFASGIITVLGYLLAEGIIYSFAAGVASVPFNIAQAIGSGILFIALGTALDKIKIQRYI